MTEAERRRIRLLQQTRAMYSDRQGMPAVHPRYRSAYGSLYDSNENREEHHRNGTFGIRLFICCMLFALFVIADYKDVEYAKVDSRKIIHEIKREMDFHLP